MALRQELIDELIAHEFTDEQIEYIDKEIYMDFKRNNNYKILCGRKYPIYISEYNGLKYYKILINKKALDGTLTKAYKQVKFLKCNPPQENGVEIYINSMFEDYYFKKDDKYNPIFTLVITSYKIADQEKREENRAIAEFNKTTYDETTNDSFEFDDLVPIDDNFLD